MTDKTNSIFNFDIDDSFPLLPIAAIKRHSDRAHSLIARNEDKSLVKEGFINIVGAVEMMAGMEYHHDNFLKLCADFSEGIREDKSPLGHEAVAYINRMGQFSAFAKSALVKKAIPDVTQIMPSIEKLLIFRHKYTAHRAIDWPRKDDTEYLQDINAHALLPKFMTQYVPKSGAEDMQRKNYKTRQEYNRALWMDSYLSFQIQYDDGRSVVHFALERDHPIIISEAYAIIDEVIKFG